MVKDGSLVEVHDSQRLTSWDAWVCVLHGIFMPGFSE
jgi:hypothetical protein